MKRSTLLLAAGVVGYMMWRKSRAAGAAIKPAPRPPVEGPVYLPDFIPAGSPVLPKSIPDFNPYDFGGITGIRLSRG